MLGGEEGGAGDDGIGSKSLNVILPAKLEDGEEGGAEHEGIVSKSSKPFLSTSIE